MPWSGSTRLNHPHLMRQAAWLPAEGSPLWDTWWSRTLGSAAAPTEARGSSGPPPERDGRSGSLGTWRLRTPHERSAEPRARGVRIGTWRSRIRLWGSESTAEDPEHFHLWDTWRHRTYPYVVE